MHDRDNDYSLIVIPFNAEKGQIVNANNLFIESGALVETTKSNRTVLAKVQSKMGKVIEGYDDGDDFIDDSEIKNNAPVDHHLDPNAFRVVLSFEKTETPLRISTPVKSKSEEAINEVPPVTDDMLPYIDAIRQVTLDPIKEALEKVHNAPPKDKELKIPLTDNIIEAIGQCIDAKVRIETENLKGQPSKKKIDQWKRDIVQLIFQHCFTVKEYTFVKSTRSIQNLYKKYLEKKEPKPVENGESADQQPAKEAQNEDMTKDPPLPPTETN